MQSAARFFLTRLPDCGAVEGEEAEEPPRYAYLAMVQSWVDWMKMPYREVEAKFRRREIVLLSWRGREQAAQTAQKFARQRQQIQMPEFPPPRNPMLTEPEEVYGEIPEQYLTDGEPDVSKMPSELALRHLRSLGFAMPVMPGPGPEKGNT